MPMARGVVSTLPTLALLLASACGGNLESRLWQAVGDGGLAEDVRGAIEALPRAEVVGTRPDGVPGFVRGDLGAVPGRIDEMSGPESLAAVVATLAPVFRLSSSELRLTHVSQDALGYSHARYQQVEQGLAVIGSELMLHIDRTGTLYAVNGEAGGEATPAAAPQVDEETAFVSLRDDPETDGLEVTERFGLALVRRSDTGEVALAWRYRLTGDPGGDPVDDIVFVDALVTGPVGAPARIVAREPQIQTATQRAIYDVHNGTTLPGGLVLNEGGAVPADAAVAAAYANFGKTHACYQSLFGRDGLDAQGGPMVGSVHYGVRHNNAFWQGEQVVYGDGDGVQFGNMTLALDVTAHELSHGVIAHSAVLVYANEPGALNEGLCDVLGATCEAWVQGGTSTATWRIGEDIFTPGVAGDALRYLYHPTLDGSSRDFYPDRYVGTQDYGGVHWNSGIVNLAWTLLASGGTHPRGKTSTVVPGIGIWRASRIFYRALTSYFTSQTNLEGARYATAEAAHDLYDGSIASSVHAAWDAVGVGSGVVSTSDSSSVELTNGTSVSGLAGAAGEELHYRVVVPVGAMQLELALAGGSGDADLYVRFGQPATPQAYDERPYLTGSDEAVHIAAPTAGTWYAMVRGYRAFDGVAINASYVGAGGGSAAEVLRNGEPMRDIAGQRAETHTYRFDVPAGSSTLRFEMSGGSGDADLYVRYGAAPTTSTYDYRPYLSGNTERVVPAAATSGTWYAMVRGYSAFAGVALVARRDDAAGEDGVLSNGVAIESLQGVQGDERYFTVDVPSGIEGLTIAMGGGSGDADLYVRALSQVSTSQYDYRPYRTGNEESVHVATPTAGRWYVLVRGYRAFSGVWIEATYE